MPWSLDFLSADALARAGAQIRRAGWTNKVLVFSGGLHFIVDATSDHLVKGGELTSDDYRALDWTDQAYTANPCAAVPAYNVAPVTRRTWGDEQSFRAPPPPGFPDPTA